MWIAYYVFHIQVGLSSVLSMIAGLGILAVIEITLICVYLVLAKKLLARKKNLHEKIEERELLNKN